MNYSPGYFVNVNGVDEQTNGWILSLNIHVSLGTSWGIEERSGPLDQVPVSRSLHGT